MKYTITILLIPALVLAFTYYGGTQEPFHFWGAGIRALACGRAFVALADDSSAILWNPAGCALLTSTEVMATYARPFGNLYGTTYQTLTFAKPIRYSMADIPEMEKNLGTFSLAFAYARASDIGSPDEPVQVNYTDFLSAFSYAKDISKTMSFGFTFKIRRLSVADLSDTGFGFDMGIMMIPNEFIHLGLKLENIKGAQIKLKEIAQEDETNLWLGGDFTTTYIDILGAMNINLSGDKTFHAGAVFKPISNIDIMGGYTTNSDEFTLGCEARFKHIGVGYCLGLGHTLGKTNMWSLRYIW